MCCRTGLFIQDTGRVGHRLCLTETLGYVCGCVRNGHVFCATMLGERRHFPASHQTALRTLRPSMELQVCVDLQIMLEYVRLKS